MRLHELDWTEGKKYRFTLSHQKYLTVMVEGYRLKVIEGSSIGMYLDQILNTYGFSKCEFTEVTVSLKDAYDDCKKNESAYSGKWGDFDVTMYVGRYGDVCIAFNKPAPVVNLDRIKWTKAAKNENTRD